MCDENKSRLYLAYIVENVTWTRQQYYSSDFGGSKLQVLGDAQCLQFLMRRPHTQELSTRRVPQDDVRYA